MSKKNLQKITALYCRLSLEDGKENESLSISNQKAILQDYAQKNGIFNYEFYIDDGFTGRNFERPDFKRMISDIEARKIDAVIVKDLSRIGRNYIEVGSYLEIFFPKNNVRFLAINDGIDSLNRAEMDIAPFKNILNDFYSRDISKKVLAGRMALSRQGKFLGGSLPYGYMRDPEVHGRLIVDPKTAPNVKLIFDLALDGYGNSRIAKVLLDRKIPITRVQKSTNVNSNYYSWGGSTINKILRNPLYYGSHVVCRTHQKGIRSGTVNFIPRDQWEIVDNAHEPTITKEVFDRVQAIRDKRTGIMQGNSCPFFNIFHSLLVCDTCGKSMQLRYEKNGRKDIDRVTKKVREPIDKCYYTCKTYNVLGKNNCTSHKIEARDLYNLVLDDIKKHAEKVLTNSDQFYDKLAMKLHNRHSNDEKNLEKELEQLILREKEINLIFTSLYEDKIKGVLTEKRFVMMTSKMDVEQEEIRVKISEIRTELSKTATLTNDIRVFIEEIRKYTTITELDEAILHRLIKQITIGEPKKINGEKVQHIKIEYNFVGNID